MQRAFRAMRWGTLSRVGVVKTRSHPRDSLALHTKGHHDVRFPTQLTRGLLPKHTDTVSVGHSNTIGMSNNLDDLATQLCTDNRGGEQRERIEMALER